MASRICACLILCLCVSSVGSTLIIHPQTIFARLGDKAGFMCTSDSPTEFSKSKIRWAYTSYKSGESVVVVKNSKPLAPWADSTLVTTQTSQTLTFESVDYAKLGFYSCINVANNSTTSPAELKLVEEPFCQDLLNCYRVIAICAVVITAITLVSFPLWIHKNYCSSCCTSVEPQRYTNPHYTSLDNVSPARRTTSLPVNIRTPSSPIYINGHRSI